MTRDPRDRYASVRKRHGRDNPRLGGSTGRWLLSMNRALRNRKRYPQQYKIVCFEDITRDPEGVMRDVCAFIGEEFAPEMMSMSGAAEHTNVGQAFQPSPAQHQSKRTVWYHPKPPQRLRRPADET